MRFLSRIERLEQQRGWRVPRILTIYSDDGDDVDVDAEVASFRAANDWPDDGLHPLRVVRVVYVDRAAR